MPKKYIVKLTTEEKQQLLDIIKKGKTSAREIRRAHTLLMAWQGKTDEAIAKTLQVSVATVESTGKQFVQENMASALRERPRTEKPRKLSSVGEACLIATTISQPPLGHQSWTLQLLADRLISLEVVEGELSVLVRQCIKQRIPNQEILQQEVTAWETERNQQKVRVNWRFRPEDARIKLKRLYPSQLTT